MHGPCTFDSIDRLCDGFLTLLLEPITVASFLIPALKRSRCWYIEDDDLISHFFQNVLTQRRDITMFKVTLLSLATMLVGAVVSVSWNRRNSGYWRRGWLHSWLLCRQSMLPRRRLTANNRNLALALASETSGTASQACSSGCCSDPRKSQTAVTKSSCSCEVCEM